MAKAISDEELQLKKRARRRLVGAIALVLLVVVFLPMVLDSEPKPLNQDISITIPPIPKPEPSPQTSLPPAALRRLRQLPAGQRACPTLADPSRQRRGAQEPNRAKPPKPSWRRSPWRKHEIKAPPPANQRRGRGKLRGAARRVLQCRQRQGAAEEIAGQQVQGLHRASQEPGGTARACVWDLIQRATPRRRHVNA